MIHNDGDVLVPLAVAGFVDANADKAVEALAGVWFEILVHTMDAAADSVPLDAHVRGNSALAQLQRHPRDHHVERLGEVGMGERPWNAGGMNAVLWAADTRHAVAQVDDDAMVVHSSPHARLGLCMVIAGAAFPTDWADMLFPFIRAQVDDDVFCSVWTLIQVDIFHNRVVDIAENLG